MTKREKRVISAFINCVKTKQYTFDYAVTLIENAEKYGYLTDEAKEAFYSKFEIAEETTAGEEPAHNTETI